MAHGRACVLNLRREPTYNYDMQRQEAESASGAKRGTDAAGFTVRFRCSVGMVAAAEAAAKASKRAENQI